MMHFEKQRKLLECNAIRL